MYVTVDSEKALATERLCLTKSNSKKLPIWNSNIQKLRKALISRQNMEKGWNVATFSSTDQLALLNERRECQLHEAMLRRELAKFRTQLEQKYRNSETNRSYVFPRPGAIQEFKMGDISDPINSKFDFTLLPASIYSTSSSSLVETGKSPTQKTLFTKREGFRSFHNVPTIKIIPKEKSDPKLQLCSNFRNLSEEKCQEGLRLVQNKKRVIKGIKIHHNPASSEDRVTIERPKDFRKKVTSFKRFNLKQVKSQSKLRTKNYSESVVKKSPPQRNLRSREELNSELRSREQLSTNMSGHKQKTDEFSNREFSPKNNPEYFQLYKQKPLFRLGSPLHQNSGQALNIRKVLSLLKAKNPNERSAGSVMKSVTKSITTSHSRSRPRQHLHTLNN